MRAVDHGAIDGSTDGVTMVQSMEHSVIEGAMVAATSD